MYLSNTVIYTNVKCLDISAGKALQPQLSDLLALTSWKLGVKYLLACITTPACTTWAKNTFIYFPAPAGQAEEGKFYSRLPKEQLFAGKL